MSSEIKYSGGGMSSPSFFFQPQGVLSNRHSKCLTWTTVGLSTFDIKEERDGSSHPPAVRPVQFIWNW